MKEIESASIGSEHDGALGVVSRKSLGEVFPNKDNSNIDAMGSGFGSSTFSCFFFDDESFSLSLPLSLPLESFTPRTVPIVPSLLKRKFFHFSLSFCIAADCSAEILLLLDDDDDDDAERFDINLTITPNQISIKRARTNRIIDSEIKSLLLSLLIFLNGLAMTPFFLRVLLVPFTVVWGDELREVANARRDAVPLEELELPDSKLL